MANKKHYRFNKISALVVFIISLLALTNLGFALKQAAQKQTIMGANSFLSHDKKTVIVRVGVNPKSLGAGKTSNQDIMEQVTVVACAYGACHFAKIDAGLGFYELAFKLTKDIVKPKHFPLQVIACSRLGCDSKQLKVDVFYP